MFICSDLKSLTEPELWKSFNDNFEMISNLFLSYLKQTVSTVITSGEYEPFDIISLMTTDQFSIMLDILFDKLVKMGEFDELQVNWCYFLSLHIQYIFTRAKFKGKIIIASLSRSFSFGAV